MFTITQSPYTPLPQVDTDLVVSVKGSVITINGDEFDFSFMEPGDELPVDAIESEHFNADVICSESGVILISLKVPVPADGNGFLPVLENKKFGKVIEVHIAAVIINTVEGSQDE